jgi:4-nitrophenyl phosphatase
MITFLFDLDGVIYRDRDPMPGAAEAVAALRAAGHRILFATNNATRSRGEFIERIQSVGVPASEDELATSASATAEYLRTLPTAPRSALVVGSEALQQELTAAGIRIVDGNAADWEQPDCVVASLDRKFTYERLARAQRAVLQGAFLVATNRDPQFPGAQGQVWPGAGSIVAAVETACQQEAVAIGKPGPLLYKTLLAAHGADLRRTIVVGDSLITDIAAAVALHLPSVLVLTGISRREQVATSPWKPTLVVNTLSELVHADLEALLG